MWKPAEVVSQHKRWATVLFSGLVIAIFAYSGYLVYDAAEAYENPSTSFSLSNNVYKYPDIYVCLYNFFGCDDQQLEEDCMRSAQGTEGGISTAVFNQDMDNEQELRVDAFLTDDRGWCIDFAASEITIAEGERQPEDYILINMFWYPGGSANASNTCIEEEGEWESHSESVFMHLRDADTGIPSAGIQVAYSCMTSASNSHIFNYVGIGLTKQNNLRSEDTATYNALATSSALYKDKRNDNITGIVSPYAWLSMEIAQGTNSLEEITEIDPLEIAEIFGNIGGFWDLLLLLWPVFFVAATRQNPHLKVRNFRKSVTRGSERILNFSKPVRVSVSARHRRELARRTGRKTAAGLGEEKPAWDFGDAIPLDQHSSRERDPHNSRTRTNASFERGPSCPPISRAPATRSLLTPQVAPRTLPVRPIREGGVGHDVQLTRDSLGQDLTSTPAPLGAVPIPRAGSSQASTAFIV